MLHILNHTDSNSGFIAIRYPEVWQNRCQRFQIPNSWSNPLLAPDTIERIHTAWLNTQVNGRRYCHSIIGNWMMIMQTGERWPFIKGTLCSSGICPRLRGRYTGLNIILQIEIADDLPVLQHCSNVQFNGGLSGMAFWTIKSKKSEFTGDYSVRMQDFYLEP